MKTDNPLVTEGVPSGTLGNVKAVLDVLATLDTRQLDSEDDSLGLALMLQTCSKAVEAAEHELVAAPVPGPPLKAA